MYDRSFIGTNVDIVAALLRKGEAVGLPTETVYGLAANALDINAVIKIFEIKQRPTFDPLIIHLPTFDQVKDYVEFVPDIFKELAIQFTPGPLTFLLPKRSNIPDIVTSGSPFVAVRIPKHPLTLAVLESIDFPLAAPSANPFGYISPTTAQHVADQLGNKIYYILDGGECKVGIESTIITMNSDNKIEVLRKGGLTIEDLENVVGKVVVNNISTSNPLAPGQLSTHYAPNVPIQLIDLKELPYLKDANRVGIISFNFFLDQIPIKHQVVLSSQSNYTEAAHNLFAGMRYLDKCDIDIIYASLLPEVNLGVAINDRLRRAAAAR